MCSKTWVRVEGGWMECRTVKRLVVSAEVWLKRRRRAREETRRYQSCLTRYVYER